MDIFFIILVFFSFICFYFYSKQKEMKMDMEADYSDIIGQKEEIDGKLCLLFEYTKYQPRKYDYILDNFFPGQSVFAIDPRTNEADPKLEYVILDRIDLEYKKDSKELFAPFYIVFTIKPREEYNNYSTSIVHNAPVQNNYAGNNYQDNRYSNYYNEVISVLNEYKTELIRHGINDSEIDSIITSPQDKQKLEYFVEKYEPILRTIEVASAAATLFDLLLKFL